MNDFLAAVGHECTSSSISGKALFDLDMVEKDMISDLLFLVGTLLGMSINYKARQDIICPEAKKTSSGVDPVIIVVLLFLIGTSILAYTAYSRLKRQVSEPDGEPDRTAVNNIKGTELNLTGLLFRITGYILSIIGISMKNVSPAEISSM